MSVSEINGTTGATANSTVDTSVTVTLASSTIGDINVVKMSAANGTATAPTITAPTGWSIWAGSVPVTDGSSPQLVGSAYYRVYQSGDTTTPVWGFSTGTNGVWTCEAYRSTTGFDSPPVTNTAQSAYAGTTTAKTTDSVTTTTTGWIVGGFGDRSGGPYTSVTGPGTVTTRGTSSHTSTSTVAGYDSGGDVSPGAQQFAATGPNTSVGWSYIGRLNPLAASGANANAGLATAVATANQAWPIHSPLKEWIQNQGSMYVAHRGGSVDYVEMTAAAYAACDALGVQALEISVWQTSDGVWVGSHDSTLDRVFGTTGVSIPASTYASLTGYRTTVGGYPLARLDDILTAYAATHIIFIENKNDTNRSNLLDLMDTYTNSTGHFVIKGPYNSQSALDGRARGYASWGYFYAVDVDNGFLPTYAPNFNLLGMDYTASSTYWTAIQAYGVPVLGHVILSAANAATAFALGANGVVTGKVAGVIPQAPAEGPTAAATGYDATVTTSVSAAAGQPTAAAVGQDATVTTSVAVAAQQPAAAAAGYDTGISGTVPAGQPTAIASGFDATISTAVFTNAPAEAPQAVAVGLDAAGAVSVAAAQPAAVAAGFDATVSTAVFTNAPAEAPAAAGTAADATISTSLSVAVEQPAAVATALDATASTTAGTSAPAGAGTAAATASDATVSTTASPTAQTAIAVATALDVARAGAAFQRGTLAGVRRLIATVAGRPKG